MGGGLGAVGCAECVHYKYITKSGQPFGELVVIFLLTDIKSSIFEQYDFTRVDKNAIQIIFNQRNCLT